MSLDCIRKKIKDNLIEEIGIGRTSAHFIEGKPNSIMLPIGGINGENKKLETKDNTYNWAKGLKKKIDIKFLANKYGSLIEIDTTNPKGTVLHIMMRSTLVDAFDKRNKGLAQIKGSEAPVNNKVNTILREFAQKNNIKVEFVDELQDRFGNNITGLYNSLDNTIKISKSIAKEDTLAEEITHAVTLALGGRKNTLVNELYNKVSKTDYKSFLGKEYIDLYENDEEILIKEAADKYISQQVLNGIKNPFTSLINRILNKFLSLFKNSNISELAEIKVLADSIAKPIINNETIEFVVPDQPIDQVFYQLPKKDKIKPSKTEAQEVYFKRRLLTLSKDMSKYKDTNINKFIDLNAEFELITSKLAELAETKNIQVLTDLGNTLLNQIETYIESLESGNKKILDKDITYTIETLNAFKSFKGTASRAIDLYERLDPFLDIKTEEEVNQYSTEDKHITIDDIMQQNKDINSFRKGFGALADLGDYLARTIGSIIKAAQNRIETANKQVANRIKSEVDLLKKYADKHSLSYTEMYEPFIQEAYGTTILTKEYTTEFYDLLRKYQKDKNSDDVKLVANAKSWLRANVRWDEELKPHAIKQEYVNQNYKRIQTIPELKKFYDFYKGIIAESANKLPVKVSTDFIPNIKRNSLLDIFKSNKKLNSKLKEGIQNITNINTYEFGEDDFVGNEELFADVVPLKYLGKLSPEVKSKDLGENLYKFASFANSYEEMSEVLPKTRLLQEQIKKKQYSKSSKPNVRIHGEESNIYKIVDDYIKMQVKGEKKLEQAKISTGPLIDENGNEIGEKYILGSDIIDFGLKYNSLLRIGLNPINAVSNVLFGDISNIIESIGGRFFTLKGLQKATNIYFQQVFNKESKMNKLLEKLNPLQELEEYQLSNSLSTRSLTGEKIKDKMYLPQREGEKFLQTRTMIAIMIKDGIWDKFDDNGELKKGEEPINLERLTDKIQRVNQMIHGRYSERDMATVQQNVLWRMAIQFKKWIPAALESRFGGKQWDNRLGVEIEGRYITAWKLLFKDLKGTLNRLQKGELTELEIYNMKKNLTEITLALASILGYIGLGLGDDDKKKNPYYKFTMEQLNRVSGDLLFFYDPSNMTRTLKSPIPLIKTTQDLLGVVKALPYAFYIGDYKFKSGPRKGKQKFYTKLLEAIPGSKPAMDVIRLYNEQKFIDYSNIP